MNCPHCQKELPQDTSANLCSFCGGELRKTNWFIFFTVLLAPAVLSFVGVGFDIFGLVLFGTFAGSLISGVICGVMLTQQRRYSILLGFVLVGAFILLSFTMCFAGCTAGEMVPGHFGMYHKDAETQ